MYSHSDYAVSDKLISQPVALFNSVKSANSISGPFDFTNSPEFVSPEISSRDPLRLIAAKSVEAAADFFASTAGYMIGVPVGWAFGVYTRTNPIATAQLGGAIGSQTMPILIKSIVT